MHLSYLRSATRAMNLTPLFVLVSVILFLNFVHGFSVKNVIDAPFLAQKMGTNRTIIVDANGKGDFKSVQAAINHIPNGNSHWIIIHIRKGVYREKVRVPRNKPYVFMKGDGRGRTSVVWSQSSVDNYDSATFKVEAPHFVAFGISFKNTAPTLVSHTSDSTKSVAVVVAGDKAAFYHCGFFSNHNTLFNYKGRHYYDNCYIQGSVDFIFGHGQAMFHDCELFVMTNWKDEIRGSITAHHGNSHSENNGFIFVKGKVYGIGDVYLGRAKGAHSRVVFANTYLSRTVIHHGWSNSSYPGSTDNLFHAEYKCHGPGSDSKKRAPWSKQLSDKEVAPFMSIDFIKGKEWLPAWFSTASLY